jgi:FkbM family methyltransferase
MVLLSVSILLGTKSQKRTKVSQYYSSSKQDQFLNEKIFKNKKNGVFVEIGADDGISGSNSYFFERFLGWTGVCIEPRANAYEKLAKNRYCICIHGAIAGRSETRDFVNVGEKPRFSGFLNTIEPQHWPRIISEGKTWTVIKVRTFNFNELCQQYNLKHVDYLSIDTEGSEEEIIRSIDFKNIDISVVDVENNFGNVTMRQYLESIGYKFIKRLGMDDIYVKG